MPLREEVLKPIPGENPGGQNLRYDAVYEKIKEARREDDELNQGAWQHERKVADNGLVINLAGEALATKSKDLQLAVWLTEGLLKKMGFGGLDEGLRICTGLVSSFWDNLYPELDDGDAEIRAAHLGWLGNKLEHPVKNTPLCRDGFNFYRYKESRLVLYEDAAKTKEQKAAREKALKEGNLAPEIFDKAFAETPKAFYLQSEKQLDSGLAALEELNRVCNEKFGPAAAPSFNRLKDGLTQVRHVVHGLLQKKRETEPDPVEEVVPEAGRPDAVTPDAGTGDASLGSPAAAGSQPFTMSTPALSPSEPADKREAIASIVAAAAVLRKRDPLSPSSYLMLRGMRWGELRGSSDPMVLQAPPTEYRQQIKALAADGRWGELLDAAETLMAMPWSRAWLDLQRLVVEACVALGDDYNAIAIAIRSELRTLLRDLPHLLEAILTDDTPAANAQTQAWLRELIAEPSGAPPLPAGGTAVPPHPQAPGWQKKFIDPHALALEAVRTGQPQKAVEILQKELERQPSGRGRFQRKLQLAQICIAAGKDPIVQLLCDDLAAAIETHKLEEWEDRAMIAGAMVFLLQTSKKIQGDAKGKQAMFERLCRLDPVQALAV
ncbi:MAG TPA: type VI secretion system protein TssA [Candidatus Acidoferrales bacterium]|nr:type VI secretion system protein TssA [Candidatus Acidoferrales bacterium]